MDQKTIDRINEYYKPTLGGRHNTIPGFISEEGKFVSIPGYHSDRKIVLTFGGKEHFETTPKEILENVFPEWFEKKKDFYVPDERTSKYIEAIKKNVELIKVEDSKDWLDLESPQEYVVGGIWVTRTEVGEKEGQYVVQYSQRTDIDDYVIMRYYFKRYPSVRNFKTAYDLHNLEMELMLHGYNKVKFRCWECGTEKHLLDIPGSFHEKLEAWKEKYCGC